MNSASILFLGKQSDDPEIKRNNGRSPVRNWENIAIKSDLIIFQQIGRASCRERVFRAV